MHDHTNRRRLSDILDGQADRMRTQWDRTEAAADFAALPAGTYECHLDRIGLFNARTGTAGVKLTFRLVEGEHAGRCVFHDLWLTPAALPQTKRDCLKLGLDSLDKLESSSLPPGRVRCRVRVALRRDDSGSEHNRVRGFDVLRVDAPEADPFAPAEGAEAPAASGADEAGDTSFDFGAHAGAGGDAKSDGGAP